MITDYEELIPKGVIFSIKEIEEMGAIKNQMMKKLIRQGNVEIVKIGNKIHISRTELIRFLKENTIENSQ
jgi:hypothetical protein